MRRECLRGFDETKKGDGEATRLLSSSSVLEMRKREGSNGARQSVTAGCLVGLLDGKRSGGCEGWFVGLSGCSVEVRGQLPQWSNLRFFA